jgi:hypothetical protein
MDDSISYMGFMGRLQMVFFWKNPSLLALLSWRGRNEKKSLGG